MRNYYLQSADQSRISKFTYSTFSEDGNLIDEVQVAHFDSSEWFAHSKEDYKAKPINLLNLQPDEARNVWDLMVNEGASRFYPE